MGKLSRTKGRAFEQLIARTLRPLYGADVRRSIQSRRGGQEGADVEGTPWFLELKCGAMPNPRRALKQAEEDIAAKGDDRPAIAVCKWTEKNNHPADVLVTMRWDTFMAICNGDLP